MQGTVFLIHELLEKFTETVRAEETGYLER